MLSADQIELYHEDLTAALEANPDDSDTLAALVRWEIFDAIREQLDGDKSLMITTRDKAIMMCDEYLSNHRGDPLITSMLLTMKLDRVKEQSGEGLEGSERTESILKAFRSFQPELDESTEYMMGADEDELRIDIIDQLMRSEAAIDPGSELRRTKALVDRIVEFNAQPRNLWVSARVNQQAGDIDGALERFESVVAHPPIPLSFEGMMLFTRKRQAMVSIADIKLNLHQIAMAKSEDGGQENTAQELMVEIEKLVQEIAQGVSEDDNQLLLLRGRVAESKGSLSDALSMYKKYNEQTNRRFTDGLWREGATARRLGQLGIARTAMKDLIAKRSVDVRALLMLADIETRLSNYESAIEQYERVLVFDVNNEDVRKLLDNVKSLQDPSRLVQSDPALALVLRARQIRKGFDGQPGDLASAIELLRKGIVDPSIDYDPRVARELAMLLMDNGDTIGARAMIVQSADKFPDDEPLSRMADAMQGDDPTAILVSLIRQSEQTDLDKEVSIANVYMRTGLNDEFDASIARLNEVASKDPRVIEMSFNRALSLNNIAESEKFARLAIEQDIDGVRGLTFKARIESRKRNHERAVELLKQGTAQGNASAAVYRMLAIEQGLIGQVDSASDSFRKAIAIRPDDGSAIFEYVAMLTRAGRFERALDVARSNQKYGISQQRFNNLWLMLEAKYGGDEGRDFAIRQRERMFELNSSDIGNASELARMYISAEKWDESKTLIDSMRASNDTLALAEIAATWNADQGRVGKQSGLMLAQQVYADYIDLLGDEATEAPYLSLARFMLGRGRPDLARQAASRAVELEDPAKMNGSKMQGDLLMATNQYAEAAKAFVRVIDNNADPDNLYRTRLIEANLRIGKLQEAMALLDSLPSEDQSTKIAMLQRAEILDGLNKFTEAREVLDRVVAKFPNDPIVYIKRAESMIGDEELMPDLLSDVDQAIKINAEDWRAYRVRAAAYFAISQRREALDDLLIAVRINPNLDEALFGVLNEMVDNNRAGEALDLA
ncbi:MAG: tetratricopeptide repeat protein [Phycisphaerales bacterium]|nr:tetratricopeptide repeat protein [Phycisphaerales bacterium]